MSCGLGLPKETKHWAQKWVSRATGGLLCWVRTIIMLGWSRQQQLCSAHRKNPPLNTLTSFKAAIGELQLECFWKGGAFLSFSELKRLKAASMTWNYSPERCLMWYRHHRHFYSKRLHDGGAASSHRACRKDACNKYRRGKLRVSLSGPSDHLSPPCWTVTYHTSLLQPVTYANNWRISS